MGKTMKKIITAGLAAIMVFSMAMTAFAAPLTKAEAKTKALNHAGLTATQVSNLKIHYDDGEFEVKFTKKSNQAKYEYEINKKTGKVKEAVIKYKHTKNKSAKKIAKSKALKKVAKNANVKLSTVKKGRCEYDREDGEWIYEITFRSGNVKYDYDVLAATGKIIKIERDYK